MKKLVSIIICLFILLCTVIPVFAEREVDPNLPTERIAPYLTDGANLLTRDEQIILFAISFAVFSSGAPVTLHSRSL